MKKVIFGTVLLLCGFLDCFSQTCTIQTSQNWNNASPPTCAEGGNAGSASIIVIPATLTLTINDAADTWTGTRIEVFGTLKNPKDITINSSITVKNGGLLDVDKKLHLGIASGCGYQLVVETSGTVDVGGGPAPGIFICGNKIASNGADCNPYPTGPPPYCEPAEGFTGPTAFDENGYKCRVAN